MKILDRNDLIDFVNRIRLRAYLLHIVADGAVEGGDTQRGDALSLLSVDLCNDLDVLLENMGRIEVAS